MVLLKLRTGLNEEVVAQPPPLLPEDDVFGEHAHQPRAIVAFGIQPFLEILGRQEPGLGFTGPGSSRSACCNRQDEQCQPRLHSVPPRLHVHCASILHATPRDDLPLLVAQLPDARPFPLSIYLLLFNRPPPPLSRMADPAVP